MVKKRFCVRGQDDEQGIYQTPDLARKEPEIDRCIESAASSDVMIKDVCTSISNVVVASSQLTPVSIMARRGVCVSPTRVETRPIEMSSNGKPLMSDKPE